MHVDILSKIQIYQGQQISAITLDEDQSILYIADNGTKSITKVNYSPELLLNENNMTGVSKEIYQNVSILGNISSIAVNMHGKIFWSALKNGQTDGSIITAVADAPNESTVQVESKLFD